MYVSHGGEVDREAQRGKLAGDPRRRPGRVLGQPGGSDTAVCRQWRRSHTGHRVQPADAAALLIEGYKGGNPYRALELFYQISGLFGIHQIVGEENETARLDSGGPCSVFFSKTGEESSVRRVPDLDHQKLTDFSWKIEAGEAQREGIRSGRSLLFGCLLCSRFRFRLCLRFLFRGGQALRSIRRFFRRFGPLRFGRDERCRPLLRGCRLDSGTGCKQEQGQQAQG